MASLPRKGVKKLCIIRMHKSYRILQEAGQLAASESKVFRSESCPPLSSLSPLHRWQEPAASALLVLTSVGRLGAGRMCVCSHLLESVLLSVTSSQRFPYMPSFRCVQGLILSAPCLPFTRTHMREDGARFIHDVGGGYCFSLHGRRRGRQVTWNALVAAATLTKVYVGFTRLKILNCGQSSK